MQYRTARAHMGLRRTRATATLGARRFHVASKEAAGALGAPGTALDLTSS